LLKTSEGLVKNLWYRFYCLSVERKISNLHGF